VDLVYFIFIFISFFILFYFESIYAGQAARHRSRGPCIFFNFIFKSIDAGQAARHRSRGP